MQPIKDPSYAALMHFLSVEWRKMHPRSPSLVGRIADPEWQKLMQRFLSSQTPRRFESLAKYERPSSRDSWFSRRAQRPWRLDLERYLRTPFKAIFFYTTADKILRSYINKNWWALHAETGETLDIYEFEVSRIFGVLRQDWHQTFSRGYIDALKGIPGATRDKITASGLPCLLLWSEQTGTVLQLAKVQGCESHLRDYLRALLDRLGRLGGKFTQFDVHDLQGWHDVVCSEIARGTDPAEVWNSGGEFQEDAAEPCDVFISYSRSDRALMKQVHDTVRTADLRPWMDQSLRCGELWQRRLKVQIRAASRTFVCLTRESVRSFWVDAEARYAHRLDKLVPILFGDTPIPEWLQRYHCPQMQPEDFALGHPVVEELIASVPRP